MIGQWCRQDSKWGAVMDFITFIMSIIGYALGFAAFFWMLEKGWVDWMFDRFFK